MKPKLSRISKRLSCKTLYSPVRQFEIRSKYLFACVFCCLLSSTLSAQEHNTIAHYNDEFVNEAYREEGEYDENGKRTGLWIVYHNDGSNRIKVELNYKNELLEGERKIYYDNGELKKKENFKEGQRDGEQWEYYENGKVYMHGNYKDGELHGAWKEYYENGQLALHIFRIDGEREGEWKAYYDNGNLMGIRNYKNGKTHGECAGYYQNGQVKYTGLYKYGEKIDPWEYYDEEGNPTDSPQKSEK